LSSATVGKLNDQLTQAEQRHDIATGRATGRADSANTGATISRPRL
jgi:hypothetical protein